MVKQVSTQGLNAFLDARFGMFVHWGLYSLIGRGEWVMHNERIPAHEYEKLMISFNPTRFNAEEWVSIAADAGQRYLVITSRHHDGFSMYDTALSDYKVTQTPFRRDPIQELADVCARRGDVKLGFYSSLLDWHHPAYRFREGSRLAWEDYLGFLHGQVRELCTRFGEIACIWFDGDWPRHPINEDNAYFRAGGSFEYEKLYDLIHELQPNAVVQNNRHEKPMPGEDIQGFEQDLPGENSAGFNTTQVYDLPVEVCMTINDHWGVCFDDENHKPARRLVHTLVRAAAVGGNYLLNVGPSAGGELHPVHVERLRQVGEWLRRNGESIYATRAGQVWGAGVVSTVRANRHYAHLLDDLSDVAVLHGAPATVTCAHLLNGAALPVQRREDTLRVTVPAGLRDPFDTVVVVE